MFFFFSLQFSHFFCSSLLIAFCQRGRAYSVCFVWVNASGRAEHWSKNPWCAHRSKTIYHIWLWVCVIVSAGAFEFKHECLLTDNTVCDCVCEYVHFILTKITWHSQTVRSFKMCATTKRKPIICTNCERDRRNRARANSVWPIGNERNEL